MGRPESTVRCSALGEEGEKTREDERKERMYSLSLSLSTHISLLVLARLRFPLPPVYRLFSHHTHPSYSPVYTMVPPSLDLLTDRVTSPLYTPRTVYPSNCMPFELYTPRTVYPSNCMPHCWHSLHFPGSLSHFPTFPLSRFPTFPLSRFPAFPVFSFDLDSTAGQLGNALDIFRKHQVNMTHIESRPMPSLPIGGTAGRGGGVAGGVAGGGGGGGGVSISPSPASAHSAHSSLRYYFFVVCDGHSSDTTVDAAIEDLRGLGSKVHLLGSYQKA